VGQALSPNVAYFSHEREFGTSCGAGCHPDAILPHNSCSLLALEN